MGNNLARVPTIFTTTITDLSSTDNPLISKARLRAFYRGANPNRSYITDEVATMLIDQIVGTPIVGFFDHEKFDYTDHYGHPTEGTQGYGYVPENYNFEWETHLDKDGVERIYACFDVHLWTGRYEEAKLIVGKQQSMELEPYTIEGKWSMVDGELFYIYSYAMFTGLCVLGDEVDPAFIGSAFYSKKTAENDTEVISKLFQLKEQYKKDILLTNEKEKIGGEEMPKAIKFNLKDSEVYSALFNALNEKYESEGFVSFAINGIKDNICIAYKYDEDKFYQVSFTEEEGKIKIIGKVEVELYSLSVEEIAAKAEITETFKLDSYTEVNERLAGDAETLAANVITISEKEKQIVDFTSQLEEAGALPDNFLEIFSKMKAHIDVLETEVKTRELAEKQEIIKNYSGVLSEEEMKSIQDNIADFTKAEVKKELASLFVEKNGLVDFDDEKTPASTFKKNDGDETPKTIVSYLNKYVVED
jgi:hypothetical protein